MENPQEPHRLPQPKITRTFVQTFIGPDVEMATDVVMVCQMEGNELHSIALHVAADSMSKEIRGSK